MSLTLKRVGVRISPLPVEWARYYARIFFITLFQAWKLGVKELDLRLIVLFYTQMKF